jgi:septal ring factor EnvC (AmiA/AmiB activator)
MSNSFSRTMLLAVAVSAFALLAWGQTEKPKPKIGPQSTTATAGDTTAYLLAEVRKLKSQTADLKTRLVAAETRLASAEAKNTAQDAKIEKKEDKVAYGPDVAGGGWATKHVFLTSLSPNKTMIRYISLK